MTGQYEIMSAISSRLRADANLQAWLVAKFNKRLKVFIGIDPALMPPASNCPFLGMNPGDSTPAEDQSHRLTTVFLRCVVDKDETKVNAAGDETVMTGLVLLPEFKSRIETALKDWINSEYGGQVRWGGDTSNIVYPLFGHDWALTFQEKY